MRSFGLGASLNLIVLINTVLYYEAKWNAASISISLSPNATILVIASFSKTSYNYKNALIFHSDYFLGNYS